MASLLFKTAIGFIGLFLFMAACLFLPAGTIYYKEAWIFLVIFFGLALFTSAYLFFNDPALLRRRARGGAPFEKEISQKIIMTITSVAFFLQLIVPALDYKFGWTNLPFSYSVIGNLLVVLGFSIIFLVFRQNSWAAATIQVEKEQKVISTGLYSIIRHPMYFGGLFLFIGIPLALGSWLGIVPLVIEMPFLIWRLLDEERYLEKNLQGYKEYEKKVKYHLIPSIW